MKKELIQILILTTVIYIATNYVEERWLQYNVSSGRMLQTQEEKKQPAVGVEQVIIASENNAFVDDEVKIYGNENDEQEHDEYSVFGELDSMSRMLVNNDVEHDEDSVFDKLGDNHRQLVSYCSENQVGNNDFEGGTTSGWYGHRGNPIMVDPTDGYGGSNFALKAFNRSITWTQGFKTYVTASCLHSLGYTWRFRFKIKMFDQESGLGIQGCDTKDKNKHTCPMIRLLVRKSGRIQNEYIYFTDLVWNANDWNDVDVFFKTNSRNTGQEVDAFAPMIVGGPLNSVLVLDDVDIRRLEPDETPTGAPSISLMPSGSPTVFCTKNFVKNNDAELGDTKSWYGYGSHIEAQPNVGYGGSAYAFKVFSRNHPYHGLLQYLDRSCLDVGSTWRFRARVKMYDEETGEGITACDPENQDNNCPLVRIRTRQYGKRRWDNYRNTAITTWYPDDWNRLDVVVKMRPEVSGPMTDEFVLLLTGGPANAVLLFDDIDVERLEAFETPTTFPTITPSPTVSPTQLCYQNFARNADFESNTTQYWHGFGNPVGITSPGYNGSQFALKAYDRYRWARGASPWQHINQICVGDGSTWRFAAKFKMYDQETGAPITTCDPATKKNCPFIRLLSRFGWYNEWSLIYDTDMVFNPDGWSSFSVDYTIPEKHSGPGLTHFIPMFIGGPYASVLVIDDVELRRLDYQEIPTAAPSVSIAPSSSPTVFCTKNFVRNPDGEFGTRAYWMGWGNPVTLSATGEGYGGTGYALKAYSRNSWHRGLSQVIDYSCLDIGSTWRFQAKVKLYDETSGAGITVCDPTVKNSFLCPMVRLLTKKYTVNHWDIIRDHEMVWNPNDWNTFDVMVKMTEKNAGPDVTWMLPVFVGGPPGSVLLIDDVKIERLEVWETPTAAPSSSMVPSAAPSVFCTKNFFKNSDVEKGTTRNWYGWGNAIAIDDNPGYGGSGYAIKAYNRNSWHRGIGQFVDFSCFTTNVTLHWQAKVKLYNQTTGEGISCDPRNTFSLECPVIRLLTMKSDGSRRWDLFHDWDMPWDPNGGFNNFDLKVSMIPENSGDDLTTFRPFFVGGPVGSVLVVDDVSVTVIDEPADKILPPAKTCRSVGDPHFVSFNGTRFDNHDISWQTLFEKGKLKVEMEHVPFPRREWIMINNAWRVSYDGQIVEQGEGGVVPSGTISPDGLAGTLDIYDPFFVRIHISYHRRYYNAYITTQHYEDATGLCADRGIVNEAPLFPENPNISEEEANAACADVAGTDAYEDCVADVRLVDDEALTEEMVSNAKEVVATEAVIEEIIQSSTEVQNVNQAEEEAMVQQAPPPPEPEEDDDDEEAEIVVADDSAVISTTKENEVAVKAEGDAVAEAASGVNGDPVIMGLRNQAFEFSGKADTWYSSVAATTFQWNMKMHTFENCVGQEGMYVTSLGLSVDKKTGGSHTVLISVADENQVFPGCPPGSPCLGDGSLRIEIDGQTFLEPGDLKISDDLRIVTYNTWSACSRKWWDYDNAVSAREDFDYLNSSEATERRLGSSNSFLRKKRELMTHVDPLEFLLNSRENMANPVMCAEWVELRSANKDLFLQLGGWSTIFIETPHVSFQVEYRQINRGNIETEQGGGSGGPEDIMVDDITFYGTQNTCKAHVLDAWLTRSSPELKDETWYGVVGETRTSDIEGSESVPVNDREQVIQGEDYSYEVTGPFDRGFHSLNQI